MGESETSASEGKGAARLGVPRHLRPTTLHGVVVALWIAVGVTAGLALASSVGTATLVEDDGLSVWETLAMVGRHAGAWFVAAAVSLGAIAVVEALLLVTGHVQHLEDELEPDATGTGPEES